MRFVIALAILSLIGCKQKIDANDCSIISVADDGTPMGAGSYLFCVNIKSGEETVVPITEAHGYPATDPDSYESIKKAYCRGK